MIGRQSLPGASRTRLVMVAALALSAALAAGPALERLGVDLIGRRAQLARLVDAERLAAELPQLRAAARARTAPAGPGLAGATDSLAEADLQTRLRSLAEAAGLVVTSAESQLAAGPGRPAGSVAVAVGLSGPLSALQRYLHRIETGSPAMVVDRLAIEPAATDAAAPGPAALRIALTVRAQRSPPS